MHCSRRAVHRRSFSTWKRWRMAEASRQPGVSCSGEKGRVSTRDGMQQALRSRAVANTPKPPHPAGLTYRFLGRLQLLQPVPQFPGGLMRRSLCGHLQGKWPCVLTMPRGAATSPRAAELAWGWGILGGGGGGTHTASQVLPGLGEEGQGPLARLGKPGGGGEPQHGGGEGQLGFHQHHSVRHLRAGASRLRTQSTRAGCGLEVRVLKTCPGVWMEVGRYPLFTASPRPYRQLRYPPFPMEEPGVAFAVRQQHDVLLQA